MGDSNVQHVTLSKQLPNNNFEVHFTLEVQHNSISYYMTGAHDTSNSP